MGNNNHGLHKWKPEKGRGPWNGLEESRREEEYNMVLGSISKLILCSV